MRSEEELADVRGGGGRGEQRDQGAGTDFVQDDLDREEHSAHRRIESRGDAASRARGDQSDALPRRHPQQLAERGTEGGADLDNGSFAADGPAAADGESRSQRFDHRHHRPDDSFAVVDRVHNLRNAVPFGLRSESLHQKGYAQRSHHGNQNH